MEGFTLKCPIITPVHAQTNPFPIKHVDVASVAVCSLLANGVGTISGVQAAKNSFVTVVSGRNRYALPAGP
jgi:hypothetical protein